MQQILERMKWAVCFYNVMHWGSGNTALFFKNNEAKGTISKLIISRS